MRHLTADDGIRESAALYALGAMSQCEARAFEDHLLEGCSVCAYELGEFEIVVGALGFGAQMVAPGREVRSLLMERIEGESPNESDLIARRKKALPARQYRRSLMRTDPFRWALVASLALLILISFQAWRRVGKTISDAQKQLDAVSNDAANFKSRLDAESRRVKELEQIRDILKTPGSRIIKLEGQEIALSSSAEIYWDTHNRRWAVTMDMPPAPEEKVYQLWFVTPRAKISAGVIEADHRGHGYSVVDLPSNVDRILAAAVTLEPRGGSLQPTMPVYAIGKVGPTD